MPYLFLAAFLGGYVLDLGIGDPRGFPHFVCGIGKFISLAEKGLRRLFPAGKQGERAAGACLVALTLLLSGGVPALLLVLLGKISPWLALAVELFFCWQIPATKDLQVESMKVYTSLKKGDLPEARYNVSMIVGRDTQDLTAEGVTKAAVETVAENTSDGVVAPILYTALGGSVLGCIYKAINTMDSMVGYQNEKYQYFGTAAAKLDDIANFLPARISGGMMVLSAYLLGNNGKNAWRIFLRDRKKHASPNSAHTEAACAGALEIQLAGDASYFGQVHHKPTLGDPIRPVEPEDIPRANRLMYGCSVLAMALGVALRLILIEVIF